MKNRLLEIKFEISQESIQKDNLKGIHFNGAELVGISKDLICDYLFYVHDTGTAKEMAFRKYYECVFDFIGTNNPLFMIFDIKSLLNLSSLKEIHNEFSIKVENEPKQPLRVFDIGLLSTAHDEYLQVYICLKSNNVKNPRLLTSIQKNLSDAWSNTIINSYKPQITCLMDILNQALTDALFEVGSFRF